MNLATILEAVLAPRTPVEERRLAHEQLEIFKSRTDALDTCLKLFVDEAVGPNQREYVLHFALRSAAELVRLRYAKLTFSETTSVKNASLTILSRFLNNMSRLVEGAGVTLALEILKQDPDHAGFFTSVCQGLRDPTWCQTSALTITSFSEMLVNEDEETLLQARRSQLTKYLVSEAPVVFALSLDLLQLGANQLQTAPRLLLAALQLSGEMMRWIAPGAVQWQRALLMLEQCASPQLPVEIVCAALVSLKMFCAHKTADLERSKVSILALHEAVRRSTVLRHISFRSDQELYSASDAILTTIEKHSSSLSKEIFVEDLIKFSQTGNPNVLADVLAVWKDLIALKVIELNENMCTILVTQMVVTQKTSGEEDEEEEQRANVLKEMAKRRPDLTCPCAASVIVPLLSNAKPQYHEAWFLVEGISNGIQDKDLGHFSTKTVLSPAFTASLEHILDLVFKIGSTSPVTPEKLKLVYAGHRLFESRSNYLAVALEYFVARSLLTQDELDSPSAAATSSIGSKKRSATFNEVRKRSASFLLVILRRMQSKKSEYPFILNTVLPGLVQRVSQAFPTLVGPERFILLECILVVGKSLPDEAARVQLTREVLSEPFQVLAQYGFEVVSNLLEVAPANSVRFSVPWDIRGYFIDVEGLPDKSRKVALALMTLSTCSQDGALTSEMWSELIPFAVETLWRLDGIWSSEHPWAQIIHPVDARCMLGSRLAETLETFLEGLVQFGETALGNERMSVIAFLSSARSCAQELLKAASYSNLISPAMCARLFQSTPIIEHRHLAALLSNVPLQIIDQSLFEQVANHVAERLRNPFAAASWRVRTHPQCPSELIEDVENAARCSLELAFTRALRSCEDITEIRFVWLADRVMLGDDNSIRLAALTITEKCLSKFAAPLITRIVIRACIHALSKAKPLSEASTRVVLDLAIESFAKVVYGISIKDHQKIKTTNRRKSSTSELTEVFGQSVAAKFIDDVSTALSEKSFKTCITEFIQDFASMQRQKQIPSSGGGGGAITGMPMAQQSQQGGGGKSSKKKKKKAARGLKDQNNDGMQVVDETRNKGYGTWHDAANSKDLGMLLLFNGKDDSDDDL